MEIRSTLLKASVLTVLLQGGIQDTSDAARWKWKTYSLRNNEEENVSVPRIPNCSRSLSFVGFIDYIPNHDDDFCFRITEEHNGSYLAQTANGRTGSEINFRVTSVEIPEYVGWKRKSITLHGKKSTKAVTINVPPGKQAVTVVELLTYWPGGDDDLAYAVRATTVGRTVVISALNDFGREGSSSVTIRATVLYWSPENAVGWSVDRIVATEQAGQNVRTLCNERAVLVSPTSYMSDTSKYKYDQYDNLAQAYLNKSQAGKKVNTFGVIQDAASTGEAIASADAAKIAWELGSQLTKWLKFGLGPDDRDDDFYFKTSMGTQCGVGVSTGDGNQYSLVELTVWQLAF
jgi:hypothetical protein